MHYVSFCPLIPSYLALPPPPPIPFRRHSRAQIKPTSTATAPAPTAEALVHRWQCEEAGRKLVLDCAGQGMSFVEADGDIADDKLDDVRCLLHQRCPPAWRSMTGRALLVPVP